MPKDFFLRVLRRKRPLNICGRRWITAGDSDPNLIFPLRDTSPNASDVRSEKDSISQI